MICQSFQKQIPDLLLLFLLLRPFIEYLARYYQRRFLGKVDTLNIFNTGNVI